MPSTRTVRRVKMRRTKKLSSCSSSASGFSKNNIIITSSPTQDDSIEEELVLNSLKEYKLEFKKRFNCLKRQHQEDMTQFATMMLHLRMSIPVDLATVTLGSTTYSLKSKESVSEHDVSSYSDSFLIPLHNIKILGSSDSAVKRPQESKRTGKKTNKLLPSPASKFKTPYTSSRLPISNYTSVTITPKMNPYTPMNMMRLPRQGEVAVSMTGSPLLVSTILHDELPHVTVPFRDGRVFSIMPRPGVTPIDIPEFDETIIAYLKTLQDHLKQFCSK